MSKVVEKKRNIGNDDELLANHGEGGAYTCTFQSLDIKH